MTLQIELAGIQKYYGGYHALRGIDIAIPKGQFVALVGPSGCGKSTLLRTIAGLETITSGAIRIKGEDITRQPPRLRDIAMVFQSYALYPHMTVRKNIAFPLKMAGEEQSVIDRKVAEAAKVLNLTDYLERKPGQLSGGQRQRVAIGRAIVRQPTAFLFDEPLSNLDAALRVTMRLEISELHQQLGTTMIYVTHDQVEAMTMADKIVVLNAGFIEQIGSPLELYHRPRNMFVAGFIGSPKMNFISATAANGKQGKIKVTLPGGASLLLDAHGASVTDGAAVTLGVRPEHLLIGETGDAVLATTVRLAEYLGSESMFYTTLADGSELAVKADGLAKAEIGKALKIGVNAAACHLFDKDGKAILNGDLTR